MGKINLAPLMTDTEVQSNPTTQIPTGFAGDKATNFDQQKNNTLNKIGFAPLFDSNTKGQATDLNARDLNALESAGFATSGLFSARANCSNNPLSEDGLLFWERGHINYQSQLWKGLSGRVFYRNKNSTWSVWSEINLGLGYGVASGTNTYAVTINGVLAYTEGLSIIVKFTNGSTGASTLNINGIGTQAIILAGGYPMENGTIVAGQTYKLFFDGVRWVLDQPFNIYNGTYVATASGTNTYTISGTGLTPFGSYVFGSHIRVYFTNGNTSASTININSVGARAITKNGADAILTGDIKAGQFYELTYDGTNFQLTGFTGNQYFGVASGTNTYAATIPGISSYPPGLTVRIKFTNAPTGPSSLNINGLGAETLLFNPNYPVENGSFSSGETWQVTFDGTNFIFVGDPYLKTYDLLIIVSTAGTDTYTCAATGFTPFGAYIFGSKLRVRFGNANTGAATLNVNSVGAIPIKKNVSSALAASDILAGQFVDVTYDGTNFQILGKI